jgi:hypothetical protein
MGSKMPVDARKREVLFEIEEEFRSTVVGVRSRFLASLHRPPADYINGELQRRGEAWRVDDAALAN